MRLLYYPTDVASSGINESPQVLDSQGRVILDSLLEGHRNEWAFKGN